MPTLSRRLLSFLAAAALAVALPACDSDDAAERDAKDAAEEVDKGAGNVDEKAGEAADDAAKDAEKGIEDVDGQ
jgi:hypothetical protein